WSRREGLAGRTRFADGAESGGAHRAQRHRVDRSGQGVDHACGTGSATLGAGTGGSRGVLEGVSVACDHGDGTMVLSTILLVPFAVAAPLPRDSIDWDAAALVRKLGGELTQDERDTGRPIVSIKLSNTRVTDEDLKRLTNLKRLRQLFLRRTAISNIGVKHL